jgi:hypothetical protein
MKIDRSVGLDLALGASFGAVTGGGVPFWVAVGPSVGITTAMVYNNFHKSKK